MIVVVVVATSSTFINGCCICSHIKFLVVCPIFSASRSGLITIFFCLEQEELIFWRGEKAKHWDFFKRAPKKSRKWKNSGRKDGSLFLFPLSSMELTVAHFDADFPSKSLDFPPACILLLFRAKIMECIDSGAPFI